MTNNLPPLWDHQGADDQGRFEIPLRESDFDTVSIAAIDDQGVWAARSTFRRDDLVLDHRGDLDVGNIELSSRALQLIVLESDDSPVEGAYARTVGSDPITSRLTDASGRTVLATSADYALNNLASASYPFCDPLRYLNRERGAKPLS